MVSKKIFSTYFPETTVMYVSGDSEKPISVQAQKAFNKLESTLTSFVGRKFYGVILGNEYRACSTITLKDKSMGLPFPTMIIPAGKYYRTKLLNWKNKKDEIAIIFEELYSLPNIDTIRPAIEYYKDNYELHILVSKVE